MTNTNGSSAGGIDPAYRIQDIGNRIRVLEEELGELRAVQAAYERVAQWEREQQQAPPHTPLTPAFERLRQWEQSPPPPLPQQRNHRRRVGAEEALLTALSERDGEAFSRDLQESSLTPRGTFWGVVKRLEQAGKITREQASTKDKRAGLVLLRLRHL